MPGVFRRRWFPTRRIKPLSVGDTTINLVGVSSTSAIQGFAGTQGIDSLSVSVEFNTFSESLLPTNTGEAVAVSSGAFAVIIVASVGVGQTVTSQVQSIAPVESSALSISGLQVAANANTTAFTAVNNTLPISGLSVLSSGFFLGNLPEGRGGSLFGFPFSGQAGEHPGIQVQTGFSSLTSTAPGPRTFWIAGIQQNALTPGMVMFPTSEDLAADTYVIGSSQFYTIGEVQWNGTTRVQGTDWEFVQPFKHIIHLLVDPNTVNTQVTFVYYRWDIGMRSGFEVTSYPVPFAFDRTSIIADLVPPLNQFFTVSYLENRPGTNPMTMYARYPVMIDDVLENHLIYDGSSGFDTYRPTGFKVFDIADNNVYTWNGSAWGSGVTLSTNTMFYSKRQRIIYVFDGSNPSPLYRTGDNVDNTYPETLTYPVFGESIGKNLLVDAFSGNAQIDFPSAYTIASRPGFYDDWLEI